MKCQELPKKKQVVTQERSKVIRETNENPFGDEEEEAAVAAQQSSSSLPRAGGRTNEPYKSGGNDAGGKAVSNPKDKKKKDNSKPKPTRKLFNLEAEKEQMKSVIADSSIETTNLTNALHGINRERERVSDNQAAVESFESCKQLRRRILRYV